MSQNDSPAYVTDVRFAPGIAHMGPQNLRPDDGSPDAAPEGLGMGNAPKLDNILLKVGHLNYSWTNTESLLIHLIAGLTGASKDAATVIFLTLNTTRARIDLVERLAKMDPARKEEMRDILEVMKVLSRDASLRNRYNHCIYSFHPETGDVSTILMRIQDRKDDIRMGKTQAVDAAELEKLDAAIARLQALNAQIWGVIKAHGFPL